jgi:peptidylprolyl isomerase
MGVSIAAKGSVACHPVANEKRQRQDIARAEKLAREAVEKQQVIRKAKTKRFGVIGGVLAAAIAVMLFLTSRGGDDAKKTVTTLAAAAAPQVTVPAGAPPKTLQIKDLKVGTGAAIQKGDTVLVRYTGVAWSTKKQFDSNWDEGRQPFLIEKIGVPLSTEEIATAEKNKVAPRGTVIAGWNEGLIGAKVGSRRQLIIPPDKGYGKAGSGPDIKADETLVFVIDVLSTAKG